jgi:predicted TIM-barrel fold metal-dependent hydrolase
MLAAEIARIRAIDNHAHVVRVVADGERDREFDALPVDNMEPASDPVWLREDRPQLLDAWQGLYGYRAAQWAADRTAEREALRARIMRERGDDYPAWILDRLNIETIVANRVTMGRGLSGARFRWAAYADALMFPLDTSSLAARNSDRRSFFALERNLFDRYLRESGASAPPATLGTYLDRVVTPTLERHRSGGAIAEKFEAAYLRDLDFDPADRSAAERVYSQFLASTPPDGAYKVLQDFLFRYIAAECGRLGMAVHVHAAAGAGSYFKVAGANPLLLEPVVNDPALRKTNVVMLHGGWPFVREAGAMLAKPNAYLDFSAYSLLQPAATLGGDLREWLEWVPEKVMFGTDAYPYSADLSWEISAWLANRNARAALALALTGMVRDGEISRERASRLAHMVLHDNAKRLYGL